MNTADTLIEYVRVLENYWLGMFRKYGDDRNNKEMAALRLGYILIRREAYKYMPLRDVKDKETRLREIIDNMKHSVIDVKLPPTEILYRAPVLNHFDLSVFEEALEAMKTLREIKEKIITTGA